VPMHGLRPCALHRGKFRRALNHRSEKPPNVCDYRNESNQIAEWNVRGRMTIVGLVFLLRGAAKANISLHLGLYFNPFKTFMAVHVFLKTGFQCSE
jgi:hypothetical protein